MKRKLLLCLFLVFSCLPLMAIEPKAVEINETLQELEAKKSKFLVITDKDLTQYEKLANLIDRDFAAETTPAAEAIELKTSFENYVERRLNMIRKVFAMFRKEYDRVIAFVEAVPAERLPAFKDLLKILDDSISDAKMKGSKDKWQDLKDRTAVLLQRAGEKGNIQLYKDKLVLQSDDSLSNLYLEAKVRLLHRWLLEGKFDASTPWVKDLAARYADHPLCLALQAHYWLVDYQQCVAGLDMKAELEKKISQKFGGGAMVVSITLKGEKSLPKAFLFYLEALKKGYPADREIPGLLPAYWQHVEVMYKKIHPYWRYPDHLKGFRDLARDLASRCQAVVEFVPFKKYAAPAYEVLRTMHRYWQEDKIGPAIIDYREITRMGRLLSAKKL